MASGAEAPPLGERRLQFGLEATLGHRADDFLRHLAVFEEDHRRDRQHFVLRRRLLVLIDVEAEDGQVLALAVDLLKNRVDDPTGAALRGPEVDEDGARGVDYVGFESRVGYVGQISTHVDRSPEIALEAFKSSILQKV
jgi:hypothetical protein